MTISPETIKAYALENAIKHAGKANPAAVLSGLFAEGLEKSQIKEFMPMINQITQDVNGKSLAQQEDEYEHCKHLVSKREIRIGLPELPNAIPGKVVMRFAPFPSGPLHIGNSRVAILNDEYVKKYRGKMILVIDDTIGSEDKPIEPEAYALIEEGVKWLDVNIEKEIIRKSDRIETYYGYAEEMIKKGYMYVCDCPKETLSQNKEKGIECACRQYPGDMQYTRWKAMFTAAEGSMCVRLKTSMTDPDPAFRDKIMFRISDRPHARLGTKYRVYPLLDFSWAIDDHLLGVTHILRGMELTMETRVEKFIWDIFGWPHTEVVYTGHFAIEGVKISKSKGSREVRSGAYSGWDDPRLWSLQSLRERGIQPEAVRQFVLDMGLKKTSVTVPVDVLYTINKKLIEKSPRYFFIENPTTIKIAGCPKIDAKLPLHPDGTLGYRAYQTLNEFIISKKELEAMQPGNYRLMHLLNFKLDDDTRLHQRYYSFISEHPDAKLKTRFINWLPGHVKNEIVEILMPDGEIKTGVGEPLLRDLKVGTIVQFERFGFARLKKIHKDKLEFWFTQE